MTHADSEGERQVNVLISGSSGGIGSAVKAAALRRGHCVFEVNRDDYAAGRLALPQGIDVIVFATGTCPIRPAALTSDELFEETVRVNCGLFLRLMREVLENKAYSADGLKVIAVSSVSATEGWPGGAAYCASKGALSALCRALDAELKSKRISVVAVEPRYVKTRMFDQGAGRMGVPASEAEPPELFAEQLLARLKA